MILSQIYIWLWHSFPFAPRYWNLFYFLLVLGFRFRPFEMHERKVSIHFSLLNDKWAVEIKAKWEMMITFSFPLKLKDEKLSKTKNMRLNVYVIYIEFGWLVEKCGREDQFHFLYIFICYVCVYVYVWLCLAHFQWHGSEFWKYI